MTKMNSLLKLFPLSLALSLGMIGNAGFYQAGMALSLDGKNNSQVMAFTPPNRGLPGGRQEGGGVRGPCPQMSEQITAISPKNDAGLTASGKPSFFLYVPQGISLPMEFKIIEYNQISETKAEENLIYSTDFKLTGTPGIISVSLPEQTPALEVGRNYYWSFTLVCKPGAQEASLIRGGWVQRSALNPALEKEISTAAPEMLPNIYQRENMWFDQVAAIANLLNKYPNKSTFEQQWQKMLNSEELGNLSEATFISYK